MRDSWTEQLKNDLAGFSRSIEKPSRPPERLRVGERRETAILFLDLSGFTALSEKLDHEETHRLANSLMGALGTVVEAHGGYVDKIEGDRIMALFGARVSGENDCIRAVACGLRMLRLVEEVHHFLSRRGAGISARAGVSYGSVTVAPDAAGHLTAMGDEVNLGSRMQEMAPVGSMLVSMRVRRICGEGFEWRDAGELPVRGRSGGVHAWEPLGVSRLNTQRWTANPLLERTALSGRDSELERLSRTFSRIGGEGGPPALVCVTGEAGIGKSRLAHEFLQGLDQGFTVLRGRALSFAQPPYWLWTRMFRDLFALEGSPGEHPLLEEGLRLLAAAGEDPCSGERVQEHLPALAEIALVSSETWIPSDTDRESRNLRLRLAVSFVLELITRRSGPVVLFIDDAQWLDSASLAALLHACSAGGAAGRFSVLAASRTDDVLEQLAAAFPSPLVERIPLAPLGDTACSGIAASLIGCSPDDIPGEALRFLLDRAQGVPYFLEELLMDILDRGLLSRGPDGWVFSGQGDLPVPSSISGIIAARFDRLPGEARRILSVASILGQPFDLELLAGTAGAEPSELAGTLDVLVRSSFLRTAGETAYSFRSEPARQTIHDMILRHNRMVLHHRAAEAMISRRGNDLDRFAGAIAWHEFRAARHRDALEWGIRMLDALHRGYQHEDVLRWAATLREWLVDIPQGGERDSLLLRVSRLESKSMEYLASRGGLEKLYEESLELARRLGDQVTVVTVLTEMGTMRNNQGRYGEAVTILEESLGMAVELSLRQQQGRATANIGLARAYMGSLEEAAVYFHDALAIFEELGDLHDIGVTLQNMAFIAGQQGDYDESLRILTRALDIHSRLSPFPRGEAVVLHNLGVHHALLGRIPEALEYYRRALRIQKQLGNRRGEGSSLGNIGCCLKDMGRIDEALEAFNEAAAISREAGNLRSLAVVLTNLAALHEENGDHHTAADCYRESLTQSSRGGYMVGVLTGRSNLARMSMKEAPEEAVSEYRQVVRAVEDSGVSKGYMPSLLKLREALLEAGRTPDELALPRHWKDD